MSDDQKLSDTTLPSGLTAAPVEPPDVTPTSTTPTITSTPVVPAVPVPTPPPTLDRSALADLAQSLNETPAVDAVMPTPVQSDVKAEVSDVPTVSEPPAPPPAPDEPLLKKKSNGKTSAIIGGLFLLIILPVLGYYVSQKTDITRVLQFAGSGAPPIDDYCDLHPKNPECLPDDPKKLPCCPPDLPNLPGYPDCVKCPSITVTHTPTMTPTGSPTSTPTMTPTGSPTMTPTSTPTSTPTNTPTNTPTPTNPPFTPGGCDASCEVDSSCRSGLICASAQGVKRCRNPECTAEWTCMCPPKTPTPIVQQIARVVVTATPTPVQVPKTPVSGAPAVLGAATVLGGIIILLLGFIL